MEKFNRKEYTHVPQNLKAFNKLKSISHNKVVKYLFGGSLERGDILESEADTVLLVDAVGFCGYKLNKNNTFSKRVSYFYGMVYYHKLKKIQK